MNKKQQKIWNKQIIAILNNLTKKIAEGRAAYSSLKK